MCNTFTFLYFLENAGGLRFLSLRRRRIQNIYFSFLYFLKHFVLCHVLPTGQPVGIYSTPLKQVVQKLPSASGSNYAKFDLTLGGLTSTKTVVRTGTEQLVFIIECTHCASGRFIFKYCMTFHVLNCRNMKVLNLVEK